MSDGFLVSLSTTVRKKEGKKKRCRNQFAHMCVLMCTLAPPQRLLPGVGASDLTVQLNLSGVGGSAAGPSQVQVKCLQASSVSQKGNFTWATS